MDCTGIFHFFQSEKPYQCHGNVHSPEANPFVPTATVCFISLYNLSFSALSFWDQIGFALLSRM